MLDLVLVIDDNDADLVFTEIVLRARGVAREVACFDTAQAALDALRHPDALRDRVSLVLLDINMPEMDGFAFLQAFEALPGSTRPLPPVVMLTSSPEAADRIRAIAHDCVKGYLVKPLGAGDAARLAALARPG
ncbi:MAG: response regulator [Rhizobacter sp.]|nr:response regulator [Rhizobacter sp.]